jgi:hypothetical protein
LSVRMNKSDQNDARGLAELLRYLGVILSMCLVTAVTKPI